MKIMRQWKEIYCKIKNRLSIKNLKSLGKELCYGIIVSMLLPFLAFNQVYAQCTCPLGLPCTPGSQCIRQGPLITKTCTLPTNAVPVTTNTIFANSCVVFQANSELNVQNTTITFQDSDITIAGQSFMQQDSINLMGSSTANFNNTVVNVNPTNNEIALRAPGPTNSSVINLNSNSQLHLTEIVLEGTSSLVTDTTTNWMQGVNTRNTSAPPPLGSNNVTLTANTRVEDQFMFLVNGTNSTFANIPVTPECCETADPTKQCFGSQACNAITFTCPGSPNCDGTPYNISVTNSNIRALRAILKAKVILPPTNIVGATATINNLGFSAHEFESSGLCNDSYSNTRPLIFSPNETTKSFGVVQACLGTNPPHTLTADFSSGGDIIQAWSFVPTSLVTLFCAGSPSTISGTTRDLLRLGQASLQGCTCSAIYGSDSFTVTGNQSKVGEVNADGGSSFAINGGALVMAAPFTADEGAMITMNGAGFSADAVAIFAARADTSPCFATNPQIAVRNCPATKGLPVTCTGNPGNLCGTQAYAARGKIQFGKSSQHPSGGDNSCGRPANIVYENSLTQTLRTDPICDPDQSHPGQYLGAVCAVCTQTDANAGYCRQQDVNRLVNVCKQPGPSAWPLDPVNCPESQ